MKIILLFVKGIGYEKIMRKSTVSIIVFFAFTLIILLNRLKPFSISIVFLFLIKNIKEIYYCPYTKARRIYDKVILFHLILKYLLFISEGSIDNTRAF